MTVKTIEESIASQAVIMALALQKNADEDRENARKEYERKREVYWDAQRTTCKAIQDEIGLTGHVVSTGGTSRYLLGAVVSYFPSTSYSGAQIRFKAVRMTAQGKPSKQATAGTSLTYDVKWTDHGPYTEEAAKEVVASVKEQRERAEYERLKNKFATSGS